MSTVRLVGCGLHPRPHQTNDSENGVHCLPVWFSVFRVKLGGVWSPMIPCRGTAAFLCSLRAWVKCGEQICIIWDVTMTGTSVEQKRCQYDLYFTPDCYLKKGSLTDSVRLSMLIPCLFMKVHSAIAYPNLNLTTLTRNTGASEVDRDILQGTVRSTCSPQTLFIWISLTVDIFFYLFMYLFLNNTFSTYYKEVFRFRG